jgi:hypothetical protein
MPVPRLILSFFLSENELNALTKHYIDGADVASRLLEINSDMPIEDTIAFILKKSHRWVEQRNAEKQRK